jgi:hypothetical protein
MVSSCYVVFLAVPVAFRRRRACLCRHPIIELKAPHRYHCFFMTSMLYTEAEMNCSVVEGRDGDLSCA